MHQYHVEPCPGLVHPGRGFFASVRLVHARRIPCASLAVLVLLPAHVHGAMIFQELVQRYHDHVRHAVIRVVNIIAHLISKPSSHLRRHHAGVRGLARPLALAALVAGHRTHTDVLSLRGHSIFSFPGRLYTAPGYMVVHSSCFRQGGFSKFHPSSTREAAFRPFRRPCAPFRRTGGAVVRLAMRRAVRSCPATRAYTP